MKGGEKIVKLWEKIKNMVSGNDISASDKDVLNFLGVDPSRVSKNAVNEVTYFTCMKMLSETLGKLSLKYYQDTKNGIEKAKSNEAHNLLKLRPNPYMTTATFWSTIENNRNHYGNAYVYCRYEYGKTSSKLKDLWIMPSSDVQVMIDNAGYFGQKNNIYYLYTDKYTGHLYTFNTDDVLHFKTSLSFDGILGLPVQEILRNSVMGGLESQEFMNNLYQSGLTGRAVLQFSSDLDEIKKNKLIEKLAEFANGAKNAGKVVPIPLGMTLTPLDIKLTDSQFFELKKYNALQIAGAFGIKPNHINDYEKSSYANSEVQNISFLVDTMQYIFKLYEQELTYKLLLTREINSGYYFKFNEKSMLRTDFKTQMESLSKGVNNAIYMPNEAREILEMPRVSGGDVLMCNGNYVPIEQINTMKGGDKSEEEA